MIQLREQNQSQNPKPKGGLKLKDETLLETNQPRTLKFMQWKTTNYRNQTEFLDLRIMFLLESSKALTLDQLTKKDTFKLNATDEISS